jgi:hypothetical protein
MRCPTWLGSCWRRRHAAVHRSRRYGLHLRMKSLHHRYGVHHVSAELLPLHLTMHLAMHLLRLHLLRLHMLRLHLLNLHLHLHLAVHLIL